MVGESLIKALPDVTDCQNQTDGGILRVRWSEKSIGGIDLQMKRALLIEVTVDLLSFRVNSGCLNKLPLATLVMSNVSADA